MRELYPMAALLSIQKLLLYFPIMGSSAFSFGRVLCPNDATAQIDRIEQNLCRLVTTPFAAQRHLPEG
jgi:hypothetical protein